MKFILSKKNFVKFKKKYFKSEREKNSSMHATLLKNDRGTIAIIAGSIITIYKKGVPLKKTAEINLGKSIESKELRGAYSSPGIRDIDENYNMFFYMNGPKMYDFKKNKIREVKEAVFKFKIDFEDRVYYFKHITNDKYQVVERKK